MILILGPCVIESEKIMYQAAEVIKGISSKHPSCRVFFKSSFDKANRTSVLGNRGPGMDQGLKILSQIKSGYGLKILTDIHESWQASEVADVVDVLQIPALLCRQTSLLQAAAKYSSVVNVKKGQFVDPRQMSHAVSKIKSVNNDTEVWLTERGSCFGYGQLVVDFRSFVWMREFAPVIFDVTHSVQLPQGSDGRSDGLPLFIPYLARAAVALGVDGLFLETHPNPEEALSDGPNACPLNKLESLIDQLMDLNAWSTNNEVVGCSH